MSSFKVLVLMSTYNGEKYLSKQFESVLNQKGVDVTILIRDDGSKDDTLALLMSYNYSGNVVKIIRGDNMGSARSFMYLVGEAFVSYNDYDYYAFCDQDDVWLEDKLISAISILNQKDNRVPALYMSAYQMVDMHLKTIPTYLKKPKLNLASALSANSATGCTMVFNRSLLNVIVSKKPEFLIMHDYWTYLVCLAVGGFVFYDETSHILYRQHEHNVIGGRKDPFVKKWLNRIRKVFANGDYFKSKTAQQLLKCYADDMSEKDKNLLQQISTCSKLKSKLKLLCNDDFIGNSLDKKLQMIGLILTGKL